MVEKDPSLQVEKSHPLLVCMNEERTLSSHILEKLNKSKHKKIPRKKKKRGYVRGIRIILDHM